MKYPLFKVKIDTEDVLARLREVFDSGYLNEGTIVNEFKSSLCKILDHELVIPTNSCTSALSMALRLSGVGPGDDVITTSMTCVATNTPISFIGANVVWADIDSKTGNIDPESVAAVMTEKTKAVICVNWAGNPCKLDELQRICNDNNVKLIQDSAHGFGSMYRGTHVCHHADFTCYSFQAIKHITCGDGGALVCKNENDYVRARAMKWFGIDRDRAKDLRGEWKGQRWEIDIVEAGHKFHMNNVSAAIGLSNLASYDGLVSKHIENAGLYTSLFSNISSISPIIVEQHSTSANWVYTIILDDKIDRDALAKSLNNLGINAGLVHVPNHPYTCFKDSLVRLPNTELFSKTQVSLPCGWWLREDNIKEIAAHTIRLCEEYK
jgi:dTDP-4-amino-4,6-dideoxygalactose transaminase